jgi:uncharacterized protein YbjT (DUF2867 family)
MSGKILITGTTGKVGSELVKLFVQENIIVRTATRNPNSIPSYFSQSTEVVEFNFEKQETFASVLDGIQKVFLIARPGDNHSDEVAKPFIEAAKKMGIQHIVNLTAIGVEKDDSFMLRKLEKNIETSGIHFTHLRPNWFMQNFSSAPMLNEIMSTGTLRLPADDAKLSFIDVRDIASAAFKVLTTDNHIDKSYTLTGKESLNHFQVVEKISNASGKQIKYIPISEDIARTELLKKGIPSGIIERWVEFYRKIRQGFCSPVYEDVELLIGCSPITFDQYANDYSKIWQ